jgi:Cytochrome P460
VAINKAAYEYFLANAQFPERTVLAMQVFEAADKTPSNVLASGVFNGRRVGLEVAVKNSSRPDGKTTAWAYYNFTDPSDRTKVLASAAAFPDHSCANCHQLHASVDNVWVQFYPALRDAKR